MKLTPWLTLIFIVYATVLLIAVGLLAYNSGRDALRDATISELQATALEKEASLNKWIEDKQGDLNALAVDPVTIGQAATLREAAPDSADRCCPESPDRQSKVSPGSE